MRVIDLTQYQTRLKNARNHSDIVSIVNDFNREYDGIPGYSFAHIVIDDYNFEDHSINWCLRTEWIIECDTNFPDRALLSPTITVFLNLLLEVPEDYRIWWEDSGD